MIKTNAKREGERKNETQEKSKEGTVRKANETKTQRKQIE